MSDLPDGWRDATLAELATTPRAITDGPFGSHLTRAHYRDSGPQVVRLQNIGDGRYIDAPAHISAEHFAFLRERHEVRAGDLLVASLGEVLPRACLAPQNIGPAIVKADCIRVRLDADVDSRWVTYALQQPATRRWAKDRRHGVGRPRLGLQGIRQIPVPLPPLDEQRRVVDVLEDHLSRLDAADAYGASALARGAALEKSVVDDYIGGATEGLATVNAGALVESKDGLAIGPFGSSLTVPDYALEGVPLIFVRDVRQEMREWPTRFVSSQKAFELGQHQALPGDVLVTKMGDPPGDTCVFQGPEGAVITSDVIRWRPPEAISSMYLKYALRTSLVRRQMADITNGVAQKKVSLQRFRTGIQIAVPDRAVQDATAAKIEAVLGALRRNRAQSDRLNMRTSALRRALLTAAFTGRLTGRSSDMDLAGELAEATA